MITKWIIDTLKRIEATALKSQYQPHIVALERVYGKDVTEHVKKLQEQARKYDAVP